MVSSSDEPPAKRGSKTSTTRHPRTPGTPPFGMVLRGLRDARSMTREVLAEKTDLSPEAISILERSPCRRPRQDTLDRLIRALDLTRRERIELETAAGYRQEQTPPIGHEREWVWLRRQIDGQRPLIVISGEPGFGKSYLLAAVAEWASERGWRIVSGGCHRYSGQEAYAPITEAIKRSIRERPEDCKSAGLKGCAWLAQLLPELLDEGMLAPPPPQTPPEVDERRRMFDAVACYLQNVRDEVGTLLVLDDLQWAGTDTFLMLTDLLRVARQCDSGRIRILGAYRANEVGRCHPLTALMADLATDDLVARWDLAPLTPEDASRLAGALLRQLLEDVDPPTEYLLAPLLAKRGAGIPIFIVLLVRALRDLALERAAAADRDAALDRDAAPSAKASRGASVVWISAADVDRIPWTIAAYVRQQVDSLPPHARDLVEVAAVAVEARTGAVLAECLDKSESELLPDLEATYRSGLLLTGQDNAGRVTYRFAHELLREAVDGKLAAPRRVMLHRALGAALERRLGDRQGEHPRLREDLIPWLAYHAKRSGEPEKAANFLRLAGDQMRRKYAHQQAASDYAELVTLLDELRRDREAAQARRDLADELSQLGRFAEAVEALAGAGDIYRMLDDVESLALVTAEIASTHALRGRVGAGLAKLLPHIERITAEQPGAEGAVDALSPSVRAWLLATLSYLSFMNGEYKKALAAAEHALDIARTTGDARLLGQARCALGVALFTVGRAAEAAEIFKCAISSLEKATSDPRNRRLLVELRLMAIWVAQTQGDFARSRELQEQALVEAQQFDNLAMIAHACIFMGLLAFYEGDWDQAWHVANSSATVLGALDGLQLGSYPPLGLGIMCLVCGRREEAMRHLDNARAIAEQSDGEQVIRLMEALLAEDELVRGCGEEACARLAAVLEASPLQERIRIELQTLLAWGTLQTGHVVEAEEMAIDAVQSARAHQMRLLLPDALRVRAQCAIARHDAMSASEALAEALALCKQMPYLYAEAKVRYVYGQLYLATDKPEQAHEQFEQARAICDKLGERMYGALIEKALEPFRVASPAD